MNIDNLLLDYNGTIAKDGKLILGSKKILAELSKELNIYVITADTNQSVVEELIGLPLKIIIIDGINEAEEKLEALKKLGENKTAAVGNGNNDILILKESILGIGLINDEGISSAAVLNSDIVVKSLEDALSLFLKPKRLRATLRKWGIYINKLTIYFAGGCFWRVEKFFSFLPGVLEHDVGYVNGNKEKISYKEVCSGSGYSEAIKLLIDLDIIYLKDIIGLFQRLLIPSALIGKEVI